jgi:dCMP deaminase
MEWDRYFFEISSVVAKNSKCLSRQVGAILVSEKSVLVSGYNGPPAGTPHCQTRYENDNNLMNELDRRGIKKHDHTIQFCPRQTLGYKSGEGLEWCIAGHGERNVLITAAKYGISTDGKSMYLTCGIPCSVCLVEIINAGIKEVVVTKMEYYDIMSQYLVDHSKLIVREYQFMKGE